MKGKPAPATPKADEECWEDDQPVEMIQGSPPHDLGTGPLAEFILDMTCGIAKLAILLGEADNEEWPHIADRYAILRSVMNQLPTGPTRVRRKVGFSPPRSRVPARGKPAKKKQRPRKPQSR